MKRVLMTLVALTACGKGAGMISGGQRDAAIAAWKKAGLDVSAFTAATVDAGKDCQSGTVQKLDVLACAYGTADEAKSAQDGALKWVGDATGSARAQGMLVIAVADRHHADPSGRTINQILKLAGGPN